MKYLLSTSLLLVAAVAVALADDESPNTNPQGMSLRLELFVSDVEKSADFYTCVLGFERLDGESDYVPVRSGSVIIGLGPAAGLPKFHPFNPELQTSRRGLGAELVLEVDDVKSYYEKVKASGYKGKLTPLRTQSWGLTDFRIVDPDGYYLRVTDR
jgi:lactoylglutathione lyase